jgi:hypothetical protein
MDVGAAAEGMLAAADDKAAAGILSMSSSFQEEGDLVGIGGAAARVEAAMAEAARAVKQQQGQGQQGKQQQVGFGLFFFGLGVICGADAFGSYIHSRMQRQQPRKEARGQGERMGRGIWWWHLCRGRRGWRWKWRWRRRWGDW